MPVAMGAGSGGGRGAARALETRAPGSEGVVGVGRRAGCPHMRMDGAFVGKRVKNDHGGRYPKNVGITGGVRAGRCMCGSRLRYEQ